MSLAENTVEAIRARVDGGEASIRAVAESAIDAAERLNPTLNAFLQIDRDGALKHATTLDGADATGSRPPLHGIPVALKDNICVRGLQTSCGSRILADYHPPYNATVVEPICPDTRRQSGRKSSG